jgi:hypothetical protein
MDGLNSLDTRSDQGWITDALSGFGLSESDPEPMSRPSCLLSISAETQHQSGKESRSFDHVIGDLSRCRALPSPRVHSRSSYPRCISRATRKQLDGISRSRLANSSDLTGLSKRKAVSSLRSTSRRPARLRRRSVLRRAARSPAPACGVPRNAHDCLVKLIL